MHKDERALARRSTTSDSGTSAREAPDFVLLGRMSMLPTLDAPRAARAAIAQWMPASIPRTLLQDAKLLVSELVTNSVRHAGAAGGAPIVVSAGTNHRAAWFDVADAGDRSRVSRRPPTGAGGMGLNIVHEVASQWGTSDRDGTHVWFELALRTA